MNVQYTDNGDGSAEFTLTVDEEDHKFSAVEQGERALLEYEETQSWRGTIRVSEPTQRLYRAVMTSEEMTEFLEENNLRSVKREKH
jgi:hypothetical protein